MRISVQLAALLLSVLLLFPSVVTARHVRRSHIHGGHHRQSSELGSTDKPGKPVIYQEERRVNVKPRKPDTVQVAGSSLPDCSHACGSCSPCRLVMVSFVCAALEEAETCPIAYKCMCRGRSYPVP